MLPNIEAILFVFVRVVRCLSENLTGDYRLFARFLIFNACRGKRKEGKEREESGCREARGGIHYPPPHMCHPINLLNVLYKTRRILDACFIFLDAYIGPESPRKYIDKFYRYMYVFTI